MKPASKRVGASCYSSCNNRGAPIHQVTPPQQAGTAWKRFTRINSLVLLTIRAGEVRAILDSTFRELKLGEVDQFQSSFSLSFESVALNSAVLY